MDRVAGYPRFYTRVPGRGKGNAGGDGNGDGNGKANDHGTQLEIWVVGSDNGFQILRFTDNFKKHNKDVFDDARE
jgi:hypothetical protein